MDTFGKILRRLKVLLAYIYLALMIYHTKLFFML